MKCKIRKRVGIKKKNVKKKKTKKKKIRTDKSKKKKINLLVFALLLCLFDCAIYIFLPLINEEPIEEVSNNTTYALAELPSVSPFFRDKFMKTPSTINPVTSRLLNFGKENDQEAVSIETSNGNIMTDKKNKEEMLIKVKKPKVQRQGDWLA